MCCLGFAFPPRREGHRIKCVFYIRVNCLENERDVIFAVHRLTLLSKCAYPVEYCVLPSLCVLRVCRQKASPGKGGWNLPGSLSVTKLTCVAFLWLSCWRWTNKKPTSVMPLKPTSGLLVASPSRYNYHSTTMLFLACRFEVFISSVGFWDRENGSVRGLWLYGLLVSTSTPWWQGAGVTNPTLFLWTIMH